MTVFVIPGVSPTTPEYTIFGAQTNLPGSTISTGTSDADYPIANAFDYRDNTEFSPNSFSGAQVFTLSQSTLGMFDYFGIFSKNGGSCALDVKVEIYDYDTLAYVEVAHITDFADGKPRLIYFGDMKTQGYYESIQQKITITATSKAYIVALHLGKSVVFPYTPSLGFVPAHLNPRDTVENFYSQGNNFTMGRRIRNGYESTGVINYIDMSDIDDWWPDFQQHVLNSRPLFFAWANWQVNQVLYGLHDPAALAAPEYVTSFHGHIKFKINGYA